MTLAADAGQHLDADRQLLLGGDNGLRAYPLRYQSGAGRWLFTAEQRWYTNWYPFRLFNVGGAAFYDMGRTFGRGTFTSRDQGLLKDIGVGLRLGANRSALGNVVHIDLSYPLDGDSSVRKLQLGVETRRSF
jgi:hemolysin activation/secretion protein